MYRHLMLLLTLITLNHICFGQEKQFEIIGTVTGFNDNTNLYLEYRDNNKNYIDSTKVIDNKFVFKGQLISETVNALLRTKNFSDYKFLWIESNQMEFNSSKGKFRNSTIKGSKTQELQNKLDLKLDNLSDNKQVVEEKLFVQNNPNLIISAKLLSVYSSTWGKKLTTILFNKFSMELKNSEYGKKINEFITLNREIKVGDKFVDFTQTNTENKPISISDFKGKIILLEFWGSWCGPCRVSNLELTRIYEEFKSKNFEIISIGIESNQKEWLDAIKKDKLVWTNITDLKGDNNTASLIYGVSSYPTNFLIDKNGIIVAKDLQSSKLRKKITQLLKD